MLPVVDRDINQGYVQFIRAISLKVAAQRRGMFSAIRTSAASVVFNSLRLSFLPLLFVYGLVLVTVMKITFLFRGQRELPGFHRKAVENVSEFITQYPMHLYPIIAKSMEMVFLQRNIRQVASRMKRGIVELAIGEGTFSNRIFSNDVELVGFDLNPYSLIHTRRYKHIAKRIISDCRNPPIGAGGASFIVCNNLLHHITDKENTIKNWAQMAPYAMFNENTNYWASGWVKPYVLKLMGLHDEAEKEMKHLEKHSLQTLWKKEELRTLICRYYDIEEELSFFNEKVFFLAAICSALLLCYGPPTPYLQKRVMNRLFGPISRLFTYQMAKLLIEYDAALPREKDTFICWLVRSKAVTEDRVGDDVALVCPDCREILQDNKCRHCHRVFEEKAGMLFLLPKELVNDISFSETQANLLKEEHL